MLQSKEAQGRPKPKLELKKVTQEDVSQDNCKPKIGPCNPDVDCTPHCGPYNPCGP